MDVFTKKRKKLLTFKTFVLKNQGKVKEEEEEEAFGPEEKIQY